MQVRGKPGLVALLTKECLSSIWQSRSTTERCKEQGIQLRAPEVGFPAPSRDNVLFLSVRIDYWWARIDFL
eukprot:6188253-Pleurochrysis_carterae.AAC.1